MTELTARLDASAAVLPGMTEAVQDLMKAIHRGGAPADILELVHLRASQINGCSVCVHMGMTSARKAGVDDDKLVMAAAWYDTPIFTDAERAALALAESATRMADRADPVPDPVWADAARHFAPKQLGAITLMIAITNFFNRINHTTHQIAGAWSPDTPQ